MNLFVVWKMNTHYIRLYILGHEPFCCVEDECTNNLRLYEVMNLFVMEDEYTYYLHLNILGYEPFCCGDEYT